MSKKFAFPLWGFSLAMSRNFAAQLKRAQLAIFKKNSISPETKKSVSLEFVGYKNQKNLWTFKNSQNFIQNAK